jgi:hypothetical protein
MGEPINVVRMTISVPREVKDQMDAATEKVNWSAIATKAFHGELLALKSERKAKTMDEVISRLKAADDLERKEEYQEGRRVGKEWAKQEARPGQLRHLPQLRNLRRSMDEASSKLPSGFENVARDAALGVGHGVGFHVYLGTLGRGLITTWGEVKSIADEAKSFWQAVLGEYKHRIESADFGQGFVDGALEVWDAVKEKL